MLRRLDALGCAEFATQLLFQRDLVGLDKGVQPDAGAAVGESDNGGIAHLGVLPDQIDQDRRVVDQPAATAFAIGEVEQAAGDGLVDLFAGHQPDAGDKGFARENLALHRRQRLWRIAALVLQQMPQVLVGRDPEQPAAGLETGGQIVMADAGAVQLAQSELRGPEVSEVAMWFGQMQRDTVDKAAHQRLPAGP